jgi:hypothetical protein
MDLVPEGAVYKVDFMFVCQTVETGLFITQLADGIMGMAMAQDTLLTTLLLARKVLVSHNSYS